MKVAQGSIDSGMRVKLLCYLFKLELPALHAINPVTVSLMDIAVNDCLIAIDTLM